LESLSGYDLSDVRVHFQSDLPARVGARAFTYGEDIYVESGAEDALAHEAWHVVQQKQGRVSRIMAVNGVAVNDDPALECEAAVVGAAAARLEAPLANQDSPLPHLVCRSVTRPVTQRLVVIQDGDENISTAERLRYLLHYDHQINFNNLPFTREIAADYVGATYTFATWDKLIADLRKRSFGYRHYQAMEMLRTQQQALVNGYLTANNLTLDTLTPVIDAFNHASTRSLRQLNTTYTPLTFISWSAFVNYAYPPGLLQNMPFMRWMRTGQAPLRMNCWEAVLYAGATGNLYTRDYAFWADETVQVPVRSWSTTEERSNTSRFVDAVIANKFYHATNQGTNTVGKYSVPKVPSYIPRGAIVAFAMGQHVALCTGRKRTNTQQAAIKKYGAQGQGILELDGGTPSIVYSTIEDSIAKGYSFEIHLGWLPNAPAGTLRRAGHTVTFNNPVNLYG
jgi:hypothetical protein